MLTTAPFRLFKETFKPLILQVFSFILFKDVFKNSTSCKLQLLNYIFLNLTSSKLELFIEQLLNLKLLNLTKVKLL